MTHQDAEEFGHAPNEPHDSQGKPTMITIDKVKETWAEGEAEASFDDWKYVTGILIDHFLSQIEDMNKKEFIEYLEELGYDEDVINDMFKESDND